jgi:peptidyl-prolyl cis-trans isomerase B (cyclophilin B)
MTPRPFRRPAALGGTLVLAGLLAACSVGTGGASTPSAAPSEAASTAPSAAAAPSDCPTSEPEPLPAGESRVVTIETSEGPMELTIEADLSPIAAGNFVALADCGYYDGVVFHRLVPGFVIQGGDPTGTGTGGPGYTITDEPVTATYGRGTVAMARTDAPDSVGSQFFIVLDDEAGAVLESYNTYQIIGTVTSGMETVDAIAAMPNSGGQANMALDPVAMDSVTVSTP